VRTVLFSVVAVVAAAGAVPASATPPTSVTGTFSVVSITTTSTRVADGATFVTAERTSVLSGAFNGTATDTIELTMHSNGTASVRGAGTCVCTVAGRTGTFDYRFNGSGIFPTSASGRYVVGQGTGGLAGRHAEGPFSGDFAVANLGGQYHFE